MQFRNFNGQFINDAANKVPELIAFLVKILGVFNLDRKQRESGLQNLKSKMTDEQQDMIKETLEKLDKVWNYSMDIVGILLRNMPEITSAAIEQQFFPLYANKLNDISDKEDYEIIDALCHIDDCLENGSQSLYEKIAPDALKKFSEVLFARGGDS